MSWLYKMKMDALAIAFPGRELAENESVEVRCNFSEGYSYSEYTWEAASSSISVSIRTTDREVVQPADPDWNVWKPLTERPWMDKPECGSSEVNGVRGGYGLSSPKTRKIYGGVVAQKVYEQDDAATFFNQLMRLGSVDA